MAVGACCAHRWVTYSPSVLSPRPKVVGGSARSQAWKSSRTTPWTSPTLEAKHQRGVATVPRCAGGVPTPHSSWSEASLALVHDRVGLAWYVSTPTRMSQRALVIGAQAAFEHQLDRPALLSLGLREDEADEAIRVAAATPRGDWPWPNLPTYSTPSKSPTRGLNCWSLIAADEILH
jgi:hypothetical protein